MKSCVSRTSTNEPLARQAPCRAAKGLAKTNRSDGRSHAVPTRFHRSGEGVRRRRENVPNGGGEHERPVAAPPLTWFLQRAARGRWPVRSPGPLQVVAKPRVDAQMWEFLLNQEPGG